MQAKSFQYNKIKINEKHVKTIIYSRNVPVSLICSWISIDWTGRKDRSISSILASEKKVCNSWSQIF